MDERLTDAQLERELEQALNIEPSPEFLARVRTRIAEHPQPSRSMPWLIGFAAAVATIALAFAVTISRLNDASVRDASVADAAHSPVRGVPLQPEDQKPRLTESVRLTASAKATAVEKPDQTANRQPAQTPNAPPFRDVLFSADEQRALVTLVSAVEQGKVPPMPAAAAVAQGSEEMNEITIQPLSIDPLPQIARLDEEQGERQ